MGIKNLNKVLIAYDLYKNINPEFLDFGSYLFIDLNCILYQCTYSTLDYPEFCYKVFNSISYPLQFFTEPKLHIYLDYGYIEIKEELRSKRKVSIAKNIREKDYKEFHENKTEIINNITRDIHKYFNNLKIYNKIIFTNEGTQIMDAEYNMINDARAP